MTQIELLKLHERLCASGRELMRRKNTDYGANNDAFANFRMASLLRLDPAQGVLLRMQDKMARLVSFLEKGQLAVTEESWSDSIVDLINYSVILAGLLGEAADKARPPVDGALSYDELSARAALKSNDCIPLAK